MRERDRQSYNAFMREYAAEEKAKEDQRLAPIRAAEAELKKTAGQLRKLEKEAALNGTDDPAFVRSLLSEPMKTIRLASADEANTHNLAASQQFMAMTPEYYASPNNARLITSYCLRNDIFVCDATTYGNVYRHLDSLGLMEHQPAPQPEPVIEQAPESTPAEEYHGVDEAGRPKAYTKSEIDRMSADDFRKYMRIPTMQYVSYQEAGTKW